MIQQSDNQSAYHGVPCAAIVFYGVSASPEQFAFFCDAAVKWSSGLGHPPDQVAIEADGFTGKYVGYPRAYSKLKRLGFESARSISFRDVQDGMYELQQGGVIVSSNIDESPCCLIATKCEVATLEQLCNSSILSTILCNLSPLYGIGYTRARQTLFNFAYGGRGSETLELVGPGYEAEKREQKWKTAMRKTAVLQRGILRHVLPVNFLRSFHLEKPIHGVTLREWISIDSRRGTLRPIKDSDSDMQIWCVEEGEVEELEAELVAAGIIFDPDVHLSSDLA